MHGSYVPSISLPGPIGPVRAALLALGLGLGGLPLTAAGQEEAP